MGFKPLKTYKLATSGASATTALQLALPTTYPGTFKRKLLLSATSADDAMVKLGGSTVAASATFTSSALPDGNFVVPKSTTLPLIDIEDGQTYASVIRPGGTDVVVYATIGYVA